MKVKYIYSACLEIECGGSQFFTKREPIHDFRRDVQSYLYYLTTKRKPHANQ